MTIEEEQQQESQKAAQRLARVREAYATVFQSEPGKIVMADLREYFRADYPVFDNPPIGTHYDPLAAAIRDGHNRFFMRVNQQLKAAHEQAQGPKEVGEVIKL